MLTVVTLGIYSAWAKGRTRRFFCRHTLFDGGRFDYHADPWASLAARLAVVALVAGGFWWAEGEAVRWVGMLLGAVLLAPFWLVGRWRGEARRTSYRGVRFSFDAESGGVYRELYAVFLPLILVLLWNWGLAAGVSPVDFFGGFGFDAAERKIADYLAPWGFLALLSPWSWRACHRCKVTRYRWGRFGFGFERSWLGYSMAMGFVGVTALLVLVAVALFVDKGGSWGLGVAVLFMLVMVADLWIWLAVDCFVSFWLGVRLPGEGRFECRSLLETPGGLGRVIRYAVHRHRLVSHGPYTDGVGNSVDGGGGDSHAEVGKFFRNQERRMENVFAADLMFVSLTNVAAIVFSLGALYPWARIRRARFLAAGMTVAAREAVWREVADAGREEGVWRV